MATESKGKGPQGDKGRKDDAAAMPRSRRKVLPSLSSADVSGLDESAQARVASSRSKLAAAATEGPRSSVSAPAEAQAAAAIRTIETNKDRRTMTKTETKTDQPASANDDLPNKVVAAKSLAGSAIGVAALAAAVALAALIAGPVGDERYLLRQDVVQLKSEGRALNLALAVEQTRMAIQRSSAPFEPVVAGIASVVGGDAEAQSLVEVLKPLARTGVPTLRQLNSEFGSLAGPALVASALPGEPSWISQTFARVTGWTTKISAQLPIETFSPPTRRALETANAALGRDDLKAALDAVKDIDSSARATLQPWLVSASRRAAAEDALSRLSELAAKRLVAKRA